MKSTSVFQAELPIVVTTLQISQSKGLYITTMLPTKVMNLFAIFTTLAAASPVYHPQRSIQHRTEASQADIPSCEGSGVCCEVYTCRRGVPIYQLEKRAFDPALDLLVAKN